MNEKVLIVGGGTGGHISPGIALYEEFKSRNVPVLFLAGERDRRFSIEKEADAADLYYYRAPQFTANIVKLPFFLLSFLTAVFSARKLLRNEKITAVVAMGGYVSAPALVAGIITRCRIYLCEQNTVPGRVITLFEKKSDAVFGTFEETAEYLKNRAVYRVTGNPIRKKVMVSINKSDAKKKFHLGHCKKILLAIGGSQGARAINELMLDLKKNNPELFKDTGVIWSTGADEYESVTERVHAGLESGSMFLSPYIDDVGAAYRAADVAVSRSGAGVMVELAALGVPSILIPYPHATRNHQEINANAFVNSGASIIIQNSDANAAVTAPIIKKLLGNDRTLAKMAAGALAAAKPDAALRIADCVLGIVPQEKKNV